MAGQLKSRFTWPTQSKFFSLCQVPAEPIVWPASTSTHRWGGGDFLRQFNGQSSQWSGLPRHCQQELLDFSCTNSSSCSSLSVFNGGSLLLFSGLMGFSLLNPSDEAGPAVLGIIPSWWVMTSGLETADLQAERRECQRFLQLNLDWWTRIILAAGLLELASTSNLSQFLCLKCDVLAIFYLILTLFHCMCLKSTLSPGLVIATSNGCHWTDCIRWLLFPSFML